MSTKTTVKEPLKPLSKDEIDTKLAAIAAAIAAANTQAQTDLSAALGAERWGRLLKQSREQGIDAAQLTSLCGKLVRTRSEWHPRNAAAALQAACIGLLCALGSSPTDADTAAFEAALKSA